MHEIEKRLGHLRRRIVGAPLRPLDADRPAVFVVKPVGNHETGFFAAIMDHADPLAIIPVAGADDDSDGILLENLLHMEAPLLHGRTDIAEGYLGETTQDFLGLRAVVDLHAVAGVLVDPPRHPVAEPHGTMYAF